MDEAIPGVFEEEVMDHNVIFWAIIIAVIVWFWLVED